MQLFILLFLLPNAAMVTAVNGCHSDRDKDHRPRKNCTAAGFNNVPPGLESSTKVLLFPNNLFSSLSWSSFQIFTEIYEIDLTGNKVPEVTPSVSPMLPSLSVLRLGFNRLTSLSDGSFTACPGLTELYLDNNAVHYLSDHTFSGLSKLEILDLSSNHIKVLPKFLLHPLPAIETLFLENNKIKVMPDDWFSQKEEVPYLYLSSNPWACSCTLDYLRRYLDDYELNVYTRDGPLIKSDAESVVCDSPQEHKGTPVINLKESDLCSPATESGPTGDFNQPVITDRPYKTSTAGATAPATTAITPPPATTALLPAVTPAHTEYHRVVTWSWYQSFTKLIQWTNYSVSVVTRELVESRTFTSHPTLPAVQPSTEGPANITMATPKQPAEETESVPSTVTPTPTPKLQVVTLPSTVPSWVTDDPSSQRRAVGGVRVFCIWLFAGCLLLCLVSMVCILGTLVSLVVWYRRVYRPLSATLARMGGVSEGVRLLTYSRREEKEAAEGGGVMGLYRSVLFIHRDGGEAREREEGGEGGEEGARKERVLVALEPRGGGETREGEGARGGKEERGVYKKTMYRLLSKEEEIGGWRDVMEERWVSAEDGERRGGGTDKGLDGERRGGGASRKCYSVILREEREEAGGRREELDWVVGGWEVKSGGAEVEEPRSSWGEWLAQYLPSMPWGVTTPPESEAAHY